MDDSVLREKIRHYLLQQSNIYKKFLAKGEEELPSVSLIAKELEKKSTLGRRRLQKYLTPHGNTKDLAVSVEDLQEFAKIGGLNMSSFVSYLFSESNYNSLKEWEKHILTIFNQLHLSLRRDLNMTVFMEANDRTVDLLELLIKIHKLSPSNIEIIQRIVSALEIQEKAQKL